MANISITPTGFVQASLLFSSGVKKPLIIAASRLGNLVETSAKKRINAKPLSKSYTRTGKLQQSIVNAKLDGEGLSRRVYVGAKYGKYVESGTGIYAGRKAWLGRIPSLVGKNGPSDKGIRRIRGMKPYPFFMPAVEEGKREAPRILREAVDAFFQTK